MRLFIAFSVSIFLFSSALFAAPIDSNNLIGRYRIEVKALGKKAAFQMTVLAGSQTQLVREYDDGHLGKVCEGPFSLGREGSGFNPDLVLRSQLTCPTDGQHTTFDINLGQAQTRDLEKGASVKVTSKDLPYSVYGKMKRF
jgi:hypothetical protein